MSDKNKPGTILPASLFRFAWTHTSRQQLTILAIVLFSMPTYFMALDLPKRIINGPIQGGGFDSEEAVQKFFKIAFDVPAWVSKSGTIEIFSGFSLDRVSTLVALSLSFLALVIINGMFKYFINTYKGLLGERMLRRFRYLLIDRLLRFPILRFRRIKPAEISSMVKDEVEPIGGFIGEAFVTPFFLGGQAIVAMTFIMLQSVSLGLIAGGIVAAQATLIPRLRRRLIQLGRQRQITARQLAGRVGELVDGMGNVHVNDTSNYERADLSNRLGRLFRIRYEIFQRKFFVKFLNNFMAQITPFLFYAIGGYFAITGRLDIGQLVGVIGAYSELPGPIKELIDWDQQRLDVQVKYTQVVDQFNTENMMDPELQKVTAGQVPALTGKFTLSGLAVTDDAGSKLIERVSASIAIREKLAIIGGPNSGAESLGDVLARLLPATSGRVSINDEQIDEIPEATTGRRMAYVPPDTALPAGSVADCILYSLKHAPFRPAKYDAEGEKKRKWDESEAARTGNSTLDLEADWIDYEAAGASGPDDIMDQVKRVLDVVELSNDLQELGLRGLIDPAHKKQLSQDVLKARHAVRKRLEDGPHAALVEFFETKNYAHQATVSENLLFGTPVGKALDPEHLAAQPYVRKVLAAQGLEEPLLEMGKEIAETAIELFADLPPDHPFFEQLSFMTAEQIPEYRTALARIQGLAFADISAEDVTSFIALPFAYIEPRHRMDLLDDGMIASLLKARAEFRKGLPDDLAGAIEFYDPDTYNRAASIQDNILLGRITYGNAGGVETILGIIREVLDEYKLHDDIFGVGLEFNVGTGGKRLSAIQRQKLVLARALLKRPDVLIVNRSLSALDRVSQDGIVQKVLNDGSSPGGHECGIIWVLINPGLADAFDRVMVMADGRLVEDGAPDDLLKKNGVYAKLVTG